MSWMLAFLGFAVLIILHEAGHFFAAKAVGMRVERFSAVLPAADRPPQEGGERSTPSAPSRSAAT